MPTIPPEVLDCSIYLYENVESAKKGERAGGSGFLVVVPLDGYEAGTIYAVTNAHVIAGGFTCVRLNTADGGHDTMQLGDADWIRHTEGDDLALTHLTLSADYRFKPIPTDSFVDGSDPTLFKVGQEVYTVGRYVNHVGRQRNRPTARFGCIAQLPYERIRTERGIEQEGFLVDMRSLAGYSGSPVFVWRPRPDLDKDPESWVGSFEHRFLGVDFGHLPSLGRVLTGNKRDQVEPPIWAEQNSGMAAVIPAWRLELMLFEDEAMVGARAVSEERWIEKQGGQAAGPAKITGGRDEA